MLNTASANLKYLPTFNLTFRWSLKKWANVVGEEMGVSLYGMRSTNSWLLYTLRCMLLYEMMIELFWQCLLNREIEADLSRPWRYE